MAKYLIQILLPVYDNEGEHFARETYSRVRAELTERFGGLTAFTRAPAEGSWKDGTAQTIRDEIVVFEVMASELDEAWWREYRQRLETRFRQDVVIIRAQEIQLL